MRGAEIIAGHASGPSRRGQPVGDYQMASWSLTHLSPPAALRARPQSPPGEDFLYKPISRARLRRARPSGLDRVQTRERECMKGLRDTVYGHTPSQTACGQLADSGGGRPAAPLRAEALRARRRRVSRPVPASRRSPPQRIQVHRDRENRPGRPPNAERANCRAKGHRGQAGSPRIVRSGPSSVKGTRRSFLTAPQKGSLGSHP